MGFTNSLATYIEPIRNNFAAASKRLKSAATSLSGYFSGTSQTKSEIMALAAPCPPLLLEAPPKPIKESIELSARGIKTKAHRSFVSDAQHTVLLSLGHGDTRQDYRWLTKYLNLNKINVVLLELPIPENGTEYNCGLDIIYGYREMLSRFVLNENSPLFDKIPTEHQISLMTHSSSGLAFELECLASPQKAEFANTRFKEVIPVSPMFDTAGSSELFEPYLSEIYTWYGKSWLARNFNVGQAPIDKVYTAYQNLKREFTRARYSQTAALHTQAVELKNAGIQLRKDIEAKLASGALHEEHPYMNINRHFITGLYDDAADHKTTGFIANLLGATHEDYPAGHMAITQVKKARSDVMSILKHDTPLDNIIKLPQRQQVTKPSTLPVSVDKRPEVLALT